MPVTTVHISGLRGSGKTDVARLIASHVYAQRPPVLLRVEMVEAAGERVVFESVPDPAEMFGSLCLARFAADRAFEVMAEVIHRARGGQKWVTILVEAEPDPALRYAHPWDHRVFVMPAPGRLEEVFRTPREASVALQEVLDDTSAFASEIFGLFEADMDERGSGSGGMPGGKRRRVSAAEMKSFLQSPLGAEIASRIQLQPAYHGLAESDVIVLNTAAGPAEADVEGCIRRLDALLARVREGTGHCRQLFDCDPSDPEDPNTQGLIERLREILLPGG